MEGIIVATYIIVTNHMTETNCSYSGKSRFKE